jgi:hypothetical protein
VPFYLDENVTQGAHCSDSPILNVQTLKEALLAKSAYQFKKRQKEVAKKKKQEEKRQRKLEKNEDPKPEGEPEASD